MEIFESFSIYRTFCEQDRFFGGCSLFTPYQNSVQTEMKTDKIITSRHEVFFGYLKLKSHREKLQGFLSPLMRLRIFGDTHNT